MMSRKRSIHAICSVEIDRRNIEHWSESMKICFIAPANNYHTKKWCQWFKKRGHQIDIISFTNGEIEDCTIHYIDSGVGVHENDSRKLKYLLQAGKVHKIVNKIKPDIINAHYATSYGTVAALAKLPTYYLSVWGSDVYDFPKRSFFHRCMLQFSLNKATYLFSTSKAMAMEAAQYTKKVFEITPFGVDCNLFSPDKTKIKEHNNADTKNGRDYVIGTVKSLSDKYGIATLLRATAILQKTHPDIPVQLRIAGKGPQESEYRILANELGIGNITHWIGFISQEQAAVEWANMDCGIIPSESESFGVSAVEAQACCTPVIISDIPGLMEATVPGKTSVIVPRKNPEKLAQAMYEMYIDVDKRKALGQYGRKFVQDTYELNHCFEKIEKFYMKQWNNV